MITLKIDKPNKCNGDYSIFVSFPYDINIINTIRELPTRYWINDTKEWEIPFKKLEDMINTFSDKYEMQIITDYPQCFAEEDEIDIPNGFEFKTKPFNHQIEGFKYGLNHSKWLLGDSMGLGKTKTVIDLAIAEKIMHGYKHCLIICGVNGLKWNWVNEINTHSNEHGYILGQKTRKNGKLIIGSVADRLADAENLSEIEEYFIITNIETLRDERIAFALNKSCEDGDIGVVAVDEIHMCRNIASQQGKGILKLTDAPYKVAMTGTPLMNHPMDLYAILRWLGYEKHSFYAFRNHHCIMGGFGGHEIIGYKNLDELQEQLNDIMLRRLKEDVLDLPEKTYIDEYVEMTSKQSKIYREVLDDIKDNIDQITIAPNPLAQLIRLRQATGYTGILSSTIQESAKLDRMEELVDEAIENGQKVVIFSNWQKIIDPVMDRLKKYNPLSITGDTNDADRQNIIDSFQNDKNYSVICGTVGALGTGVTLTAASVMIFLDIPWNDALYSQAVDRFYRIGQTNNVTVYNITCRDTIDERILEIVRKKGAMSNFIVDGHVVGDKGKLIDYLIN